MILAWHGAGDVGCLVARVTFRLFCRFLSISLHSQILYRSGLVSLTITVFYALILHLNFLGLESRHE